MGILGGLTESTEHPGMISAASKGLGLRAMKVGLGPVVLPFSHWQYRTASSIKGPKSWTLILAIGWQFFGLLTFGSYKHFSPDSVAVGVLICISL